MASQLTLLTVKSLLVKYTRQLKGSDLALQIQCDNNNNKNEKLFKPASMNMIEACFFPNETVQEKRGHVCESMANKRLFPRTG